MCSSLFLQQWRSILSVRGLLWHRICSRIVLNTHGSFASAVCDSCVDRVLGADDSILFSRAFSLVATNELIVMQVRGDHRSSMPTLVRTGSNGRSWNSCVRKDFFGSHLLARQPRGWWGKASTVCVLGSHGTC